MTQQWTLAHTAHGVMMGQDAVFLDVQSDAYRCMAGAGAVMTFGPNGAVELRDAQTASALVAAGLIRGPVEDEPQALRSPPPLPTASARPEFTEPLRLGDLPELCWSLLDLLLHYRGRRLTSLLERAHAGRPSGIRGAPSPELLAQVARFHRWSPWAPIPGKCLLRSFMLLRVLQRHGCDAQWVFAVRTWPFVAHCWLQVGEVVLDDDFERLAAFHPIMVA